MSADRGSQYKEWILNVIDQLRSRKARPDLDRICHFVERKHGLARAVTESQVEKLVDQGVVIKVVYKRGTSYRNATKTRKRGFSNVQNSNIASRKITEALYSILKQRKRKQRQGNKSSSDRLDSVLTDESHQGATEDEHSDDCFEGDPYESEEGVSAREIETWLSDDDGEPFMCPISLVIQREVDAGRLIQLENGNYMPAMGSPAKPDEKPATEVVNVPQTLPERPVLQKSVSVVAKRGRPPKRKLPMGRSFSCNDAAAAAVTPGTTSTITSPEAQVAPIPVMPPHLCDFCQLSARCNRRGQEEELLFCKDCNAKAHPSCMQYSPELAKRAQNTAWQCIDCKTCCICFDPGEADCMLFCDACDKGYHMQCHEPEVDEKPQGKWICTECVNDGVDIDEIEENNNVVDSTVRSTDTESVTTSHAEKESSKNSKYARENGTPTKQAKTNEVYPNASGWAISDVVNFFQQKGFTEQAIAFKEQEIDGQSLLLLKRSDVLQGLSLKLGPALKMYNYVMKLQTAGQPFS